MIPLQPFLPWKISITILHGLAILTAFLRFEYRRRTRRLWWDDHAALVPAIIEFLNIAVFWIRIRHFDAEDDILLRQLKIDLSYINSACFATIIWWPRISMALAIVRITPHWSKLHRITLCVTFLFILNWIALGLAFIITCVVHSLWTHANSDILVCGPAYYVTPASVTTDIVGDTILVILPLHHLWRLRLRRSQRRLILMVFSTSLLTLITAVVVVIFSYASVLRGPGGLFVWLMVTQIEEAISVIASNLTVLISWGYRVFMGDANMDTETEKYITPHWSRPLASLPPIHVLSELSATLSEANDAPSTSDTRCLSHTTHDDDRQPQGSNSKIADQPDDDMEDQKV
ncbi:hypothetical protein BDQ17DRAFT_733387 [Cyathus striatus]|nr:hypothetical protein BDQ17DRAFT_733387 [Cyathus striatus]